MSRALSRVNFFALLAVLLLPAPSLATLRPEAQFNYDGSAVHVWSYGYDDGHNVATPPSLRSAPRRNNSPDIARFHVTRAAPSGYDGLVEYCERATDRHRYDSDFGIFLSRDSQFRK